MIAKLRRGKKTKDKGKLSNAWGDNLVQEQASLSSGCDGAAESVTMVRDLRPNPRWESWQNQDTPPALAQNHSHEATHVMLSVDSGAPANGKLQNLHMSPLLRRRGLSHTTQSPRAIFHSSRQTSLNSLKPTDLSRDGRLRSRLK